MCSDTLAGCALVALIRRGGIDAEKRLALNTLSPSPASASTFFNSESDDDSKQVLDSDGEDFLEEGSYLSPQEIHAINKMHIDHQFLLEQNRSLARELAYAKMTAQALRSIIQQRDDQLLLSKEKVDINPPPPKLPPKPNNLCSIIKNSSKLRLPFRLPSLSSSRNSTPN
ncbi:hypothetical protein L0F63_007385 [Massospora cicadina]|nr:hypothetical protein L0F63_007385 [Massospora cicadina]